MVSSKPICRITAHRPAGIIFYFTKNKKTHRSELLNSVNRNAILDNRNCLIQGACCDI